MNVLIGLIGYSRMIKMYEHIINWSKIHENIGPITPIGLTDAYVFGTELNNVPPQTFVRVYAGIGHMGIADIKLISLYL